MSALRLGTRRSVLARTQATIVADQLRELGHDVELVEIETEGDRRSEPLTEIGGTGVFAAALRRALLEGEVDLAVHSLKDLPVDPHPGLLVAAVPVREDPSDVVVAREGLRLTDLPPGSVIGTGSPRRARQLDELGLGVTVRDIRGNVDTRLRLVADGTLDAIVLARAGLARLRRLDAVTETLGPHRRLPAPGQGALAVECRADRADVRAAVRPLEHPPTRAAVTAERALLAALEAGCSAPVGALAEPVPGPDASALSLAAWVGLTEGSSVRRSLVGALEAPEALGSRLAAICLEESAAASSSFPAHLETRESAS